MGSGTEIVRYRKEKNGRIVEVVIWRFFEQVPGSAHRFNYRFFYGMANGTRLVQYDNERDQRGHRHVGDVVEAYRFTTLRTLLADFEADIERN